MGERQSEFSAYNDQVKSIKIENGEIPDDREKNLMTGNVANINQSRNYEALSFDNLIEDLKPSLQLKFPNVFPGYVWGRKGLIFKKNILILDSQFNIIVKEFLIKSLDSFNGMFSNYLNSNEFFAKFKAELDKNVVLLDKNKISVNELITNLKLLKQLYLSCRTHVENMPKVA